MLCSTAVLQVPGIRHQMDRVLELHLNMFEGGAVRLEHPAAPSLLYTLVPDLNPVSQICLAGELRIVQERD